MARLGVQPVQARRDIPGEDFSVHGSNSPETDGIICSIAEIMEDISRS